MDNPPRIHGLKRPLHPLQILSWLIMSLNVLGYFSSTLPCLPPSLKLPISLSFSILLFLSVLFGYKLSISDPTDPIVLQFKSTQDKNIALQLEEKCEKFCNFCKSPVSSSSKHCVRCNRCTLKFDHHCKWVNNCIGEQNYSNFIRLIVVVWLFEMFQATLGIMILVQGMNDQEKLNENIEEMYKVKGFYYFIAVEAIFIFEGTLFTILIGYLIGLHVLLKCKGLTTYEYIISRRSENKVIPKEKRCDTNSALNNNQSFNAKDLHRSLSRSDIDLRDSPRYFIFR